MVVAVMKMYFPKMNPRVNRYRKYKTFNKDAFVYLCKKSLSLKKKTRQKKVLGEKGFGSFSEICKKVIDKHTLPKNGI